MKKTITKISIYCTLFLLIAGAAKAQTDTAAEFKPHGKLWGYAFGDYAYKGSTDEAKRGGSNQYTNIPVNSNEFQFRRIYLGYNYEISRKFVAEFLLAAEDDFNGNLGQGTGDVLSDGKLAPYVKLANLRWRNLWKGTDLVVGQAPTPTFAQGSALKEYAKNTQTSEEVWGYRSIERTITDIRRTPSFDMGATLQGWIDGKGNYGYDLMVANGQSAKPENDPYKWFYGDVYAKFFDKRLIINFYQDYEKLNWNPLTTNGTYGNPITPVTTTTVKYNSTGTGVTSVTNTVTYPTLPAPTALHRDREMSKLFVAWNDKKFTIGVEYFMATLLGDVQLVGTNHNVYYRTTNATGLSVFARGAIYKDKLGFFARFDSYDPTGNLSNIVSTPGIASYSALTSQYDPTTKEQFVTFGLDYTPIKNVHIMPNVWMNTYASGVDATGSNSSGTKYSSMNSGISPIKGTDCVYRLTFYYVYGK